jgi:hypothetical protein
MRIEKAAKNVYTSLRLDFVLDFCLVLACTMRAPLFYTRDNATYPTP